MWLVYGAWSWLIVSSLVIFNTRGDVAAANHALPGTVLVLLLHGGVWLYKRNKGSTPVQRHAAKPAAPSIDDAIYDQIADEMSSGDINGGLMARAIAEADGDKDRTQAIYIRLRAATIAKEREQVQRGESDAKEFTDSLKTNDAREQFVKSMVRTELSSTDAVDKEAEAWNTQAEENAKAFVDANENQRLVKRHWGNVLMHRVGIVILWLFILNFVLAIIIVLFMRLNGTSLSGASIGLDLAIVALYAGVALLGYLGTEKLKW